MLCPLTQGLALGSRALTPQAQGFPPAPQESGSQGFAPVEGLLPPGSGLSPPSQDYSPWSEGFTPLQGLLILAPNDSG